MDVRRFFMFGAAALALIIVVATVAIFSSNEPDVSRGTRLATVAGLEARGVIEFADRDLFLVWNEGQPLALSADAQHVGDSVIWCESSQMFESPAHGEKFDSRGYYYGGPARSGLARFPIEIEGDEVVLTDTGAGAAPERGEGPAHDPRGPFCIED